MPLRVGAKKAEIKSACLLVYGFGITSRQNQNGFGFHQCAAWQRCHANGGASRVGDSEVLLHHGVEGGEVGQIGEVGVELNDVVQAAACGFTHGTQVFEHLVGLGFKVVAHQLHGIGHEGVGENLLGRLSGCLLQGKRVHKRSRRMSCTTM